MNSLAYNSDLTAALLSITVVVTTLCLVAVGLFFWRRRPVKKDDYQRNKIHDRLAELANATPEPRKSA